MTVEVVFDLEFIRDIQSLTYFNMCESWNINYKIVLVQAFSKCGLDFFVRAVG